MEEALVTDDETESLGVEKREAILGFDQRGEKLMEQFYDVMVESFGTGERRKPKKRIENLLDCKRL